MNRIRIRDGGAILDRPAGVAAVLAWVLADTVLMMPPRGGPPTAAEQDFINPNTDAPPNLLLPHLYSVSPPAVTGSTWAVW